jgi:hypothetical protein
MGLRPLRRIPDGMNYSELLGAKPTVCSPCLLADINAT